MIPFVRSTFQKPRCMILRDGEEPYSEGSKAVYAEYLLMRTQAICLIRLAFRQTFQGWFRKCMQRMIVFAKILLDIRRQRKAMRMKRQQKSKASGFLLDKPKEREARRASSMDQWLTNTTSVNDKIAQASVRDGGPSLEVLILQKRDGKIAFAMAG